MVTLQVLLPFTDANGFGDPSILSSLKTVQDAVPTPTQTVVIGGMAALLTLVAGWPGSLLSGVIVKRYDAVLKRLRERRKRPRAVTPPARQPIVLALLGFLVAAVISGFVDPGFGLNPLSVRIVVTGFLTYLVFNVVGSEIVAAVVRRVQPDSRPFLHFRWGSLVIVVLAVCAARLLGFQPGIVFGLVAGLTFAITLAESREALVVLVGSGFTLGVALVAWVAFSFVAPATAGSGNVLLVSTTEFLSGLTIGGISSLPIVLLPFAVLEGGSLFGWKKWVWAFAYAIALVAFMVILVTVPNELGLIPADFVRWVVIFAAFGFVAVIIWAIDLAVSSRAEKKASLISAPKTR